MKDITYMTGLFSLFEKEKVRMAKDMAALYEKGIRLGITPKNLDAMTSAELLFLNEAAEV